MSSSQNGDSSSGSNDASSSQNDSSSSPPPPSPSSSSDQSSPPPPSDQSSPLPPSDQSSPPPPSDNSSPPPPSDDSSASPPPPPEDNHNDNSGNDKGNNNNSGDNGNNDNNGNDDDNSSSSPPPPNSSSSTSDNSNSHSHSPPHSPPWRAPPPPEGMLALSTSSGKSVTLSGKTAVIVGASVGGGLVLILVILCIMACCRKKKRDKKHGQMNYFTDTEQGAGNGHYNNSGHYGVKLPPVSSHYSSGPWMGAAPPPLPPGMTSSELSSANYSGPPPLPPPQPSMTLGFNQSTFSYQDLAAATGGFDKANLLGQGGFGYVHKGILPNGKEVAVKSLKAGSGQGEREFQAEVDIISRVHHRHLVSLVGYCIADAQRMLVYEFVPNGSLEHHLYGKDQPVMDFPTRLKISLGAAKGFAYLHEDCHPRIIHRDIKAANILLDYNYEAKVADFGLAKLSNDAHTHVSTRIMGTFGYLAPEYAASGKLTEKSDVYSYGVVLLELITGKRPIDLSGDDDSLVDWSRPILEQVAVGGSYEELVDPRLEDDYNPQEMLCMVACAAACIRHSARRRPRMSQVVRALEGDASLEDLNEGGRHNSKFGSSGSSDYDAYGSGIRRVRPRSSAIMSSGEFTSSEHMQNEYGIHASPTSSADSNGSRRRTP